MANDGPIALGLTWGENPNREDGGTTHVEWHAPCGCAFHPIPFPHIHPCGNEHKRPDLHTRTERGIHQFTPTHCAICETSDFTWADCVHGAYAQGLSDAIKEVEKARGEWAHLAEVAVDDVGETHWRAQVQGADKIIKRLKSLGTQEGEGK